MTLPGSSDSGGHMRLKDLDRAVWFRIACDLGDLADEIATAEAAEEHWPTDTVAVEVFEMVQRASTMALVVASKPDITTEERRAIFAPSSPDIEAIRDDPLLADLEPDPLRDVPFEDEDPDERICPYCGERVADMPDEITETAHPDVIAERMRAIGGLLDNDEGER